MKHLDLFSGIGGFALAVDTVWPESEHIFVENDPFCQEVLRKHWKSCKIYGDIRNFSCKEFAQDAERQENLRKHTIGALRAEVRVPKIIIKNTEKNVSNTQKKGGGSNANKLLNTTEGSASVAGRKSQNFSPLTTNSEEGTKSANHLEQDTRPTSTLSEKDFLIDSNCSATTATAQKDITGNAPTKYDRTLTNTESKQTHATKQGGLHAELSSQDRVFLLTGGFPCQPFSQAGRRKGTEDDRHFWPEMLRVIREFRPEWVIGENVAGLLTIESGLVFEQVCTDLEKEGYEVQPFIIPAVAVNAPHRRDRVWIVAHSKSERTRRKSGTVCGKNGGQNNERLSDLERTSEDAPDTERTGHEGQEHQGRGTQSPDWTANWLEVATRLCRMDARVSTWVDGRGKIRNSRNERLKSLGNSIVPQVAIEIMRAIKNVDDVL